METFKRDFIKYFNVDLKGHLGYPETFDVEFYADRIVLKPDRQSQLIGIIKNDKQFKDKLLSQLTNNIKKVYPNAYDVSFNTDKQGNLIVKFDTQQRFHVTGLAEIAVEIATHLDEKSLNEFCRTHPTFQSVCSNLGFWIALIETRFPQYYKKIRGGYPTSRPAYNWEKVYKGLLFYDTYKDDIERGVKRFESSIDNLWKLMSQLHPETIRYLVLEDIFPLSKENVKSILFNSTNISVVKHIFDTYKIDNQTLLQAFNNSRGIPELMNIYLNYKGEDEDGNLVELSGGGIRDMYTSLISSHFYYGSPKEWKVFYDKLDGSYTFDSLLQWLFQIGLSQYSINPKILDYIVNMLPSPNNIQDDQDSIIYLLNWFKMAIRGRAVLQIKSVWSKYKDLFNEDDIEELRQEIKNNFDEEWLQKSREELLRIIK